MSLAALLHRLRDGLLMAANLLERGDEIAAAEEIERTISQAREDLEDLRAAA